MVDVELWLKLHLCWLNEIRCIDLNPCCCCCCSPSWCLLLFCRCCHECVVIPFSVAVDVMTPVVAVVVDVIVIIIDVFIPVDVIVDVILVFLIFKDVTAAAVFVAAVNCDRPSQFSIQIFVLDERLNKQQHQRQQRPIQIGFKKNGDNKNGKKIVSLSFVWFQKSRISNKNSLVWQPDMFFFINQKRLHKALPIFNLRIHLFVAPAEVFFSQSRTIPLHTVVTVRLYLMVMFYRMWFEPICLLSRTEIKARLEKWYLWTMLP